MPSTHTEAWHDLMRRAKAAGINVCFNHGGVAVLTLPASEKQPVAPAREASVPAASPAPGAPLPPRLPVPDG